MRPLFRPGDRVKTRRQFRADPSIPVGATGTIILVVASTPDIYLVRFDGYGARIVWGGDIELATPPAAHLRAA